MIYNLSAKQFGYKMRHPVLWALVLFQIVCKDHQWVSNFVGKELIWVIQKHLGPNIDYMYTQVIRTNGFLIFTDRTYVKCN